MVHAQAFPFPPHSTIIEIPEDFVVNKNCFLMQNFLVLWTNSTWKNSSLRNQVGQTLHWPTWISNTSEKSSPMLVKKLSIFCIWTPGQWDNFVQGVVSNDLHLDHLPKNIPLTKVDRALGFFLFDIIKKENCIKSKLKTLLTMMHGVQGCKLQSLSSNQN